jgi:hypothetical protein
MSNRHIINLIEQIPFSGLSENDLSAIKSHTADCSDCRLAFEAAHVSALLLKERVAEQFEPSPFFQTRVMARLRERQVENESWAWSRMWRSVGALASSMVATVAALALLTFVVPGTQMSAGSSEMTAVNVYSAEEVLLDQSGTSDDQISDGQILTSLYGADDDSVR